MIRCSELITEAFGLFGFPGTGRPANPFRRPDERVILGARVVDAGAVSGPAVRHDQLPVIDALQSSTVDI